MDPSDLTNNDDSARASSVPPTRNGGVADDEWSRTLEKLREIKNSLSKSAEEVLASKPPEERPQLTNGLQHRPFDRDAIREHYMGQANSVIQKCNELRRQWGLPVSPGSVSPEPQPTSPTPVAEVNGVSTGTGDESPAGTAHVDTDSGTTQPELTADESSGQVNGMQETTVEDATSAENAADSGANAASTPRPDVGSAATSIEPSIADGHQPSPSNPLSTGNGDHLLDDPMDGEDGGANELTGMADADHLLDEPAEETEQAGESEGAAKNAAVDENNAEDANSHADSQPGAVAASIVPVDAVAVDDATTPPPNAHTLPPPSSQQCESSSPTSAVVPIEGASGVESTTIPRELQKKPNQESTKRGSSTARHREGKETSSLGNVDGGDYDDGLDDDDGYDDELEDPEDDVDMVEKAPTTACNALKPLSPQTSTSADTAAGLTDPQADVHLSEYEVDLLKRHSFKRFKIRLPLEFDAKALVEIHEATEKSGRKRQASSDPIDQLLRGTNYLLNRKRRPDAEPCSDGDSDYDDESAVPSTSSARDALKRMKSNTSGGCAAKKGKPSSSGGGGRSAGGGASKASNKSSEKASKSGKQPPTAGGDGESGNEEECESDEEEAQQSPRKIHKRDRLLHISTSILSDESDYEQDGGGKAPRKKKNPDAQKSGKSRRETVYVVSSDSDSDHDDEFVDDDEMESDATDDGIDTIVVAGSGKVRRTRGEAQGSAHKEDRLKRKRALRELEDQRRNRKRGESGELSKKSNKRRRVAVDSDDEEEVEEVSNAEKGGDEVEEEGGEANGSGRMRFRKMIPQNKLSQSTKDAERAEAERVKRLKQRQLEFNGIELVENARTGECEYTHPATARQARVKLVVLDDDRDGKPSPQPLAVHPLLVRKLMRHQAEGIRFLYNSTFESLSRLDEPGGGAILAHWMGLGKTLQVIAYLHTILGHPRIAERVSRVLVIGPKNVAINWCVEFEKWLGKRAELNTINVVNAAAFSDLEDRLSAIKGWYEHEGPSVLVINYELFRILTEDPDDRPAKKRDAQQQSAVTPKPTSKREKKLEKMKPQLRRYLQNPGPDLVVCDEGHRLKKDDTALHRAVSKILTSRRICLTGTPLQNYLDEYYTMVNFVKPSLLGNKQEFRNRFSNIITKGRAKDADLVHVRAMRRRCHVLYRKLQGVVDRKSHGVIASEIPPKHEYVVFIRLTPRQIALYKAYLAEVVSHDTEAARLRRLYTHFHTFMRICAHPHLLIEHNRALEARAARRQDDQSLREFVVDEGEEDGEGERVEDEGAEEGSDDIEVLGEDAEAAAPSSSGRQGKAPALPKELPQEQRDWFRQLDLVSDTDVEDFELSNKLLFLAQVIRKCEQVGDKLLVFSQSLESIRLIRRMLHTMAEHWFDDGHDVLKAAGEQWGWKFGADYLVIEGSTSGKDREAYQEQFNDMGKPRTRLLIISTKAGSLGTNLVGANRVVIFDVSWNPTHDTQALFRSYRLGQKKPVYAYRLVAQGTMEERIYARCVTKEATALRVVDEAQIQRIFYERDLDELFRFDPDKPRIEEEEGEGGEEVVEMSGQGGAPATGSTPSSNSRPLPTPKLRLPEDKVLAGVIRSYEKCIVRYDRHDSLFEEQEEEQLNEQEREEAWQDYDDEVNNRRNVLFAADELSANPQYFCQEPRDDPIYPFCWNVRGMTEPMAQLIVLCSRVFDRLLTKISAEERGDDINFADYVLDICTRHWRTGDAESLIDELYRSSDSTLNTIASFNETVKQEFKTLNMSVRHIINALLFQHGQIKQHQKEKEKEG